MAMAPYAETMINITNGLKNVDSFRAEEEVCYFV